MRDAQNKEGHMIPALTFKRIVVEKLSENLDTVKISPDAVLILQTAIESSVTMKLQNAARIANNCKRITVNESDYMIANEIKGSMLM